MVKGVKKIWIIVQLPILFLILGFVLGVFINTTYLSLNQQTVHVDFVFWWSIASTLIGVVLLAVSIWQAIEAQSEREKAGSQVKVWMNAAAGLSNGLNRIVADNLSGRYASTNDVCNAVWAVQASAFSLYQGLYEERCVDEEEYKQRQKRMMDQLAANQAATSQTTSQ